MHATRTAHAGSRPAAPPLRAGLGLAALSLLSLTALGLPARPAAAQDLGGQTVHVTGPYPTINHPYEDLGTGAVTAGGTTFTDGAVNVTVSPTQVVFTFNTTSGFAPVTFNGYAVTETGPAPVTITGVTLDPSSDLPGFTAGRVSFDATDVFANFQGLSFTPSDGVTLDLSFAPAAPSVPEPSQTASLGLGALGLLGLLVRARRRRLCAPSTPVSAAGRCGPAHTGPRRCGAETRLCGTEDRPPAVGPA